VKIDILIDVETGRVERLGAWHPFDGEWVYIEQIAEGDKMIYKTGGAVSGTAEIDATEGEWIGG
jgi:hypothetical protein